MKKIRRIAQILIIIGVIGLVLAVSKAVVSYNTHFELPLGRPSAIVVDSALSTFLCLEFYSSIQKYDSVGSFVKNWQIPSMGGALSIRVKNDTIEVLSTKADRIFKFDADGVLISEENSETTRKEFRENRKIYYDKFNNIYELSSNIINPSITKNNFKYIDQNILQWTLMGPLPVFLFFLVGLIILYFTKSYSHTRFSGSEREDEKQ